MKKNMGVCLSVLMTSSLYGLGDYRCMDKSLCEVQEYKEVLSIDAAFSEGSVDGKIRLGYINQDNHADGVPSTYATSLGGQFAYETAKFYHISAAATAFVSQKVSRLSGDKSKGELNGDFFDAKQDSFSYLGEAYIDYGHKNIHLRIGRQKLDTPLNDRDDIRILPNTFAAAMAGYGGITDTVLVAGYINSWAGYDSGDDISKFKDLPGDIDTSGEHGKGVILAGVMNESIDNVELQAWYYDFDMATGIIYADAAYGTEYASGLGVEAAVQYGNYTEKSSSRIEGDIYGGLLSVGYDGLTLSAASNTIEASDGKYITIGWGGGPYFTSMEEWTIDGMNDGEAYVFGAEVDFSKILLEGISLAYAYGRFNGNAQTTSGSSKVEEHDLIVSYAFAENADLEISYAGVNDKENKGVTDVGYDRFLVRANYVF